MTYEVILYFIKKLRLYIVSIQRNVYQNRFINECANKKKAKIPDSRSFLARYRGTYILDKLYHANGGKFASTELVACNL